MTNETNTHCFNEVKAVVAQIKNLSDADQEALAPETLLGSQLNMKSMEFVRMVTMLQQRFSGHVFPFQQLFVSPDGSMRRDLSLADVAAFITTITGSDGK